MKSIYLFPSVCAERVFHFSIALEFALGLNACVLAPQLLHPTSLPSRIYKPATISSLPQKGHDFNLFGMLFLLLWFRLVSRHCCATTYVRRHLHLRCPAHRYLRRSHRRDRQDNSLRPPSLVQGMRNVCAIRAASLPRNDCIAESACHLRRGALHGSASIVRSLSSFSLKLNCRCLS